MSASLWIEDDPFSVCAQQRMEAVQGLWWSMDIFLSVNYRWRSGFELWLWTLRSMSMIESHHLSLLSRSSSGKKQPPAGQEVIQVVLQGLSSFARTSSIVFGRSVPTESDIVWVTVRFLGYICMCMYRCIYMHTLFVSPEFCIMSRKTLLVWAEFVTNRVHTGIHGSGFVPWGKEGWPAPLGKPWITLIYERVKEIRCLPLLPQQVNVL